MSDPRHDLVAAKWDEMRAEAKKQGMPVIVSFYDGAHEVVAFGSAATKQVFIHSGEFATDGTTGGEILCAFDALTLAKMLPSLVHALNVATGITKSDDEEPELEPRDD